MAPKAKIIRFPNTPGRARLSKHYKALAHFLWMQGLDTLEIKLRLGVSSEAIVYNSLSEVREDIRKKAKRNGPDHKSRLEKANQKY